jgi:hypothetical protein
LQGAGWGLQLLALVVTGYALLVGLIHGSMRTELVLLGVGIGLFLLGRWLQGKNE